MSDSPAMRVALVQTKPAKGDYARNLAAAGEAFAQLAEDSPDLIVLPEAALSGYFLEGGVYDVALPAAQIARDLGRAWRAAGGKRADIVAGFFENDEGTYYNSALYVESMRKASASSTGIEKCSWRRTAFLTKNVFFPEAANWERSRRGSERWRS